MRFLVKIKPFCFLHFLSFFLYFSQFLHFFSHTRYRPHLNFLYKTAHICLFFYFFLVFFKFLLNLHLLFISRRYILFHRLFILILFLLHSFPGSILLNFSNFSLFFEVFYVFTAGFHIVFLGLFYGKILAILLNRMVDWVVFVSGWILSKDKWLG